MTIDEKIEMVKGQIQENNSKLEKLIGLEITKDIYDCIQTLVIKINQYGELNMEKNKRVLENKYDIDKHIGDNKDEKSER
jgi:hypothetical protein